MFKFLKKIFSKDYVKIKYEYKTKCTKCGGHYRITGICHADNSIRCIGECRFFIKDIPKKKIILCRKFKQEKLLGKKAVIKFDGIELKGVSE